MLIVDDFSEGLPIIIEDIKAHVTHADADGITAESVLPIGPRESRHMQWMIPAANVPGVVTYDGDRDFAETGTVLCDGCGRRVAPRSMESLPEHHCTERQRTRRAEES